MNKGQTLIELILTVGLGAILLPVLLLGVISSREGKAQQNQRIDAVTLLKEGEEAVRNIREKGWSTFPSNGIYHPKNNGSSWTLDPNSESTNNFTRSITIDDAKRDTNGSIVTTGGITDPSTKKIIVSVSWLLPLPSSVTSTLYLTRTINTSLTQTTVADFTPGTRTGTIITNTNGGEVTLGAGGGGSWCNPNLSISALDLPKSGVANALYAIEGKAFAGTGDNASGVSYASVSIDNSKPPHAAISGTFDGFKTNDGIFGDSNYAYLATDTNSKEVEIVDLSTTTNGKYSEAGYFDAPGNGNANSVFVSGTVGYMVGGNKLYSFDVTNKTGSRPQLGSLTLTGTGEKVIVSGNYAYIAESGSTQLQIVKIDDGGRELTVVGQANLNGSNGKNLVINSSATRAYIITKASYSQKEFFIVDISTKTGDRPTLGSFDTAGMDPRGVTTVPGNKAIVVGIGGQEYQVLDISNEANPTQCGFLNIDSGVNGIASVIETDGDAYSYIITGDANAEFKIIEGGPGGQYANQGTFTSSTYDAGTTVAFNRITPNFLQPNSTSLRFQVASAAPVSGSCTNANYVFIGPDGTSSSYFTSEGPIPLSNNGSYVNPGQCFKYKVFFSTSDSSSSPVLYDMSINYSL